MCIYSTAGDQDFVFMEEPKIETDSKTLKDYGRLSAPMVPHSVNYPRGKHLQPKQEKPKTNKQGLVEQLVRKYTSGVASENEFRNGLRRQGVKIDSQFDKLISKHEAGDFISHKELGKEALRRVIEPSKYNHVNKINLQNPSYLVKENKGKDPVSLTSEITQKAHEDTYVPKANMRFLHENTQNREIYGKKVYVGTKGKSKIDVQNQLFSSEPNILKWEKGKTDFPVEQEFKPSKKIFYDHRDHHKLYSNHGTATDFFNRPNDVHRSSYSSHQANRTNFNIFGF